jgi:acyl carrier protein
MDNEIIKTKVKELLLMYSKNKKNIENDTDLLKEHILDSISFIQMVSQLEKEFKIEYEILELEIENFKNINTITKNIEEKIKR